MKKCSICGDKHRAKGLCKKHYDQKWLADNRSYATERRRRYYKTAKGRAAVRRAVKRYEERNRDKRKAWTAAQCVETEPCEVCGELPTHRHHQDHGKPGEVMFLCPLHHKQKHQQLI